MQTGYRGTVEQDVQIRSQLLVPHGCKLNSLIMKWRYCWRNEALNYAKSIVDNDNKVQFNPLSKSPLERAGRFQQLTIISVKSKLNCYFNYSESAQWIFLTHEAVNKMLISRCTHWLVLTCFWNKYCWVLFQRTWLVACQLIAARKTEFACGKSLDFLIEF